MATKSTSFIKEKSEVALSVPFRTNCASSASTTSPIFVSGIHLFHFFFLHVEADSPETCLGFLYGKGQAHIAQAHDAYRDFSFRNAGKEFFFHYCLFF